MYKKQQKQPPEVLCKKRCSQKFRKIHSKTPAPESLFNKVGGLRQVRNFIQKENLAQVFFCEFCEISKSTFITERLGKLLLYKHAVTIP